MADHEKIQSFVKLSLIFQVCGFLILVIGLSTPYWRAIHFEYVAESRNEVGLLIQGFDEGLWRRCINSICADIDLAGRDWMRIDFWIVLSSFKYHILIEKIANKYLYLTSTIASFIVTGSTFLSIMIYGAIIKEGLAWSFVMVTVSGAVPDNSGRTIPGKMKTVFTQQEALKLTINNKGVMSKVGQSGDKLNYAAQLVVDVRRLPVDQRKKALGLHLTREGRCPDHEAATRKAASTKLG
ncbi:unnamed protein product [Mytilus coruscus]|uniref:Uncharacterized protein n=1 Tax=Mytilus coruscus TaxID=42192 RepID=A0A6J8AU74_MYTCO|nr:unnamed protein product [Mytilus coruscus]